MQVRKLHRTCKTYADKLLSVHCILQSLAGFKSRCLGGRNLDFLIGSGVTASAGAALTNLKGTKTNELNLITLLQRLRNLSLIHI